MLKVGRKEVITCEYEGRRCSNFSNVGDIPQLEFQNYRRDYDDGGIVEIGGIKVAGSG